MPFCFNFSIRFALVLLVAVCIGPASMIAVTLLSYDYLHGRESQIESSITTARTIVYSVDKEFSETEATLRALATSPSLSNQELRLFYHQAKVVQNTSQVRNIVLSDPAGKQLFDTRRPFGELLVTVADSTNLRRLANTNGPVLSKLTKNQVSNEPVITVSIPVRRAGKHLYNLSADIFPDQFAKLLKQQQLSPDWIVAVIDGNSTIVARTHEMDRFSGKKATSNLLDAMAFDNEGWFEGTTSEGIPVLGMFSRSAVSNWSVAIGIPSASLTRELRTKLGWLSLAITALIVCSIGSASYIGKKIAESVRGLREPALALGQGMEVAVPSLQLREANEVAAALKQASSMLQAAQHQAMHDVLTGLPNRVLFNDLVPRQIAIAARSSTHFSVLYIDLDGFKPVNDIHGHAAGDHILCEVAHRLQSELRASDMAARLGGDEFAVILVGTPGSSAKIVADNLIEALSKAYEFNGIVIRISASIGVAGYPEAGMQEHELLRRADLAMYQAKTAGKGRVICAGGVLDSQP